VCVLSFKCSLTASGKGTMITYLRIETDITLFKAKSFKGIHAQSKCVIEGQKFPFRLYFGRLQSYIASH
jgi:hypothetical protein